jgi:tetratricopeptide (TPR) repeat protein
MFMSLEPPQLVEQLFLWLGSSQTGSASALSDAKRKDDAKAKYLQAIVNNSDAFQNLGICYRETDQKDLAFKAFTTADKLRKSGR